MDSNTLKQARFLQGTIKHLQGRILKQHGPVTIDGSGHSLELTATQFSTLAAIHDLGEMTLKEIAEATHVSPPSASNMVDKLVEAGVLNREHSKIDRREVHVTISPSGLKAMKAVESRILEALIELLDGIGPEHAKMWCEVYEHIEQYVQETDKNGNTIHNVPENNAALGAR